MPVTDNQASAHNQLNTGEFTAKMVISLVVLFWGLLSGLAINGAIRFLVCACRHRDLTDNLENPEREIKNASTLPTFVFSAGTKLTGAEVECAICLADFVDGDRIRVLPACNHRFHVQCADTWLATRPSCPTCRVSSHITLSKT